MKTVLVLIYLSFIAALVASGQERYSLPWVSLAVAVVVLFLAAFLRVLLIANAPGTEE
ncbi:hypothetical protein ACWGJ9_07240 [Curtobacterium citreum]